MTRARGRRVVIFTVAMAGLLAAVGVVNATWVWDSGSYVGDANDQGWVGDIHCTANCDFQGSPSDGTVDIETQTIQFGTDIGVPSDEGGVKLASTDAYLDWEDIDGTGTHTFTFGYDSDPSGTGSSSAWPVPQAWYSGSFEHQMTGATLRGSDGFQESFTWMRLRVELEDVDTFDLDSAATQVVSATRLILADSDGIWATYSPSVHALTSYAGYNDPPAQNNPGHNVDATLTVLWTFKLSP